MAGNYVFSPNTYRSLGQDFSLYDPAIDSSRVNDHSAFANIEHRPSDSWKVTGQVAYLRYAMRGPFNWIAAGSFNPLAPFAVQHDRSGAQHHHNQYCPGAATGYPRVSAGAGGHWRGALAGH